MLDLLYFLDVLLVGGNVELARILGRDGAFNEVAVYLV